MKYYRIVSLLMAVVFVLVGLCFLFFPDAVLEFFNSAAEILGMRQAPVQGYNFYLILAAGYMYMVSLLAWLMFKHPENSYFPLLLTHAKLASSLLSLGFFIFHQPFLIYLVNFIVDGGIGLLVCYLYLQLRKRNS